MAKPQRKAKSDLFMMQIMPYRVKVPEILGTAHDGEKRTLKSGFNFGGDTLG